MPSCICWGSRFVIIFATWTHRSLELIVINCLYFNFSRQVSKLAWLQSVRLMLLISFATWTRRSLALIVIDCLYFSSSRQVSKLAWLQLVRLMLATWTPWSTFATCHRICDHLSLLGPIGHFRYLWSTVSTSNLSRHGMPSCGWWDTHLCPKAAFPSQGGKDPPSIPSVESIALRPIPWQGQGQGVITFGPKTFALRHRTQAKG